MELELPVPDPGAVRSADDNFACPNCDAQLVHKLAQLLLPGLATACVDSTAGDPFRSPSSVAVQLRKEMVDYITHRSQTLLIDQMDQGQEVDVLMEDPTEAVAVFLDDFAISKRSVLGHVSGWLLPYSSDAREDRIDDFVQEMETTRFWPLERREAVARTLLRNVDATKTRFHCPNRFVTEEGLAEHGAKQCGFRPVRCRNQGCRAEVSARRAEEHDEVCQYKVLPCEQGCEVSVMRREMDRHCVTNCSMKLTNCPFYQVGCESAFPSCDLESHCKDFLQTHLLKVLEKKGLAAHELKERLVLLEKSDSDGTLVEALDLRSLTNALGELEKKMSAAGASSNLADDNAAHPRDEAMHTRDSD